MVCIHRTENISWFCRDNIPLFNLPSPLFIYIICTQLRSSERKTCPRKKNDCKILALVFLFLLKLRFPANKSVAEILRKRYGTNAVKWFRKFEKLDFKIRKNEADGRFLQSCHQEGL